MVTMIRLAKWLKDMFAKRRMKPPWRNQTTTLSVLQTELTTSAKTTTYDTDSYPIRIDNHSSYCVSPSKKDFVGKLTPISANIRGIGGNVKIRYKGTVKWKWEDDLGQTTTHLIPNTLFMPTSPDRILSPQHWSQQ